MAARQSAAQERKCTPAGVSFQGRCDNAVRDDRKDPEHLISGPKICRERCMKRQTKSGGRDPREPEHQEREKKLKELLVHPRRTEVS